MNRDNVILPILCEKVLGKNTKGKPANLCGSKEFIYKASSGKIKYKGKTIKEILYSCAKCGTTKIVVEGLN